ncbi:MAG: TPM domain-containing protein [Lachnospiraceae bacterium]|nr:TPM domain-containing protein [Candidatus Merdinaster equi]
MKEYFKRFKVLLILTGVTIIVFLVFLFTIGGKKEGGGYTRGNYDCPTERVYDFAGLLSDDEEDGLRYLIAQKEDQIGCDIIIVTLNQPLRDYALEYLDLLKRNNGGSYNLTEDKYVQVFADNFFDNLYDEYYGGSAYGYNYPNGDGVILVDNWDRSDSVYNYAYNWIGTSGRCQSRFSRSDIQDVIDDINDIVNDDPYGAYVRYINDVSDHMLGRNDFNKYGAGMIVFCILGAIVVALIYLAKNIAANKGKKTTNRMTYVPSGKPQINVANDILINVHVSHHKISSSSGGGGGGSHFSAGGHSHGGGGGHH